MKTKVKDVTVVELRNLISDTVRASLFVVFVLAATWEK